MQEKVYRSIRNSVQAAKVGKSVDWKSHNSLRQGVHDVMEPASSVLSQTEESPSLQEALYSVSNNLIGWRRNEECISMVSMAILKKGPQRAAVATE